MCYCVNCIKNTGSRLPRNILIVVLSAVPVVVMLVVVAVEVEVVG